jgi:hypothetical protein
MEYLNPRKEKPMIMFLILILLCCLVAKVNPFPMLGELCIGLATGLGYICCIVTVFIVVFIYVSR